MQELQGNYEHKLKGYRKFTQGIIGEFLFCMKTDNKLGRYNGTFSELLKIIPPQYNITRDLLLFHEFELKAVF